MGEGGGQSSAKAKVVKKKVRPYPFEASLELNGIKKGIEIMYVSPSGLIVRLKAGAMVFVGEHYQLVFELPVARAFVNSTARVIKTYDRSMDLKASAVDRMAELHFENLSEDHRKNILSFMAAIGQK